MKIQIEKIYYDMSINQLNKIKNLATELESPYMKALREITIPDDRKYLKGLEDDS